MARVRFNIIKPKKRPSNKTLRDRCDDLWRKIIKRKGRCDKCGSRYGLEAHHVIGRGNNNLRWDLRNGICLCLECHDQQKAKPKKFLKWFEQRRPDDYEYLLKEKNRILDFINYDKILEYLSVMKVENGD